MKVKNVELKWYVLRWDFNKKCIVEYNIFPSSLKEELYKQIKSNKITNYDEFKEYIDKWSMYNYWSRTEYEISMGPLWPNKLEDLKEFEKIGVYRQIKMNLDNICKYIICMMDIKF